MFHVEYHMLFYILRANDSFRYNDTAEIHRFAYQMLAPSYYFVPTSHQNEPAMREDSIQEPAKRPLQSPVRSRGLQKAVLH